jgi:hypothetical protein
MLVRNNLCDLTCKCVMSMGQVSACEVASRGLTCAVIARVLVEANGYVMPKAAGLAKEKAGPIGARVVYG